MAKKRFNVPLTITALVETGVWAVIVVEAFYRLATMQLDGVGTSAAAVLAIEVAITSLMFNRARAHKEGSDAQKVSLEAGELCLLSTVLLVFGLAVGASAFDFLTRSGYTAVTHMREVTQYAPIFAAFLPLFFVSIGFFFFSRALRMIVVDCLPPGLRPRTAEEASRR